jgi:hypothetical protein
MLNLTRLHLGIAHESQFQGLGISRFAYVLGLVHLRQRFVCWKPRHDLPETFLERSGAQHTYAADAPHGFIVG